MDRWGSSRRRRGAVLVAVALLFTACSDNGGSSGPVDDTRPLVVVTHSLLGDVVRNVVGGQADVEVVMPPGTDPH